MFKKLLALTVVAAFVLCAGVASAAWESNTTAVKVSTSLDETTKLDDVYIDTPIFIVTGTGITDAGYISVDLGGGATFVNTLDVVDDKVASPTGDLGYVSLIAVQNSNSALLDVTSTMASGHRVYLEDTGTAAKLSLNVGDATGSATLTLAGTTTVGSTTYTVIPAGTVTMVEFVDLISVNASNASLSTTIDVAADKLAMASGNGRSGTSELGTQYATYILNVANIHTDYADSSNVITDVNTGDLWFAISGDMSAVSAITAANVTSANSSGDSTSGTSGSFTVDTTNDMAYAGYTGAVAFNAQASVTNLTVLFDGSTEIPEGSWTITPTVEATSTEYAEVSLSAFTFLTLANNGFQFVIPYFNSNITTYNSTVVLNNAGTDDAPVSLEVLATSDTASVPVGTTATMTTLTGGATQFYSGQSFLDALGLTDAYGGTAIRLALEVTVTTNGEYVTGLMFQSNSDGSKRTVPLLVESPSRYGW